MKIQERFVRAPWSSKLFVTKPKQEIVKGLPKEEKKTQRHASKATDATVPPSSPPICAKGRVHMGMRRNWN